MATRQPIQRELFQQAEHAVESLPKVKLCSECMVIKDRSTFIRAYCRPCTAKIHKEWRRGIRRPKQTDLKFFDQCRRCSLFMPKAERHSQNFCRICGPQAEKERYVNRRESLLAKSATASREQRFVIIEAYGGKCACCGESRYQLLNIDHINGGGTKQMNELGGNRAFERWLARNGYPKDDYRLLCYNCNMGRFHFGRGINGECPHKTPLPHIMAAIQPELPIESPSLPPHQRICICCGEVKDLESGFYKNRDTKEGTFRWKTACKDCMQKDSRNPFPRLPNTKAGIGVLKKCPHCKLWQTIPGNFAKARSQSDGLHNHCYNCTRVKSMRLRFETMIAYGGKCDCCGLEDWRFLQIDHIFGDGAEERRDGCGTGEQFYRRLKSLGYPQDRYRALCANCNNCIGRYGGICVHELERKES